MRSNYKPLHRAPQQVLPLNLVAPFLASWVAQGMGQVLVNTDTDTREDRTTTQTSNRHHQQEAVTVALFAQRLGIISGAVVRQFSTDGDSHRAKHLHRTAV